MNFSLINIDDVPVSELIELADSSLGEGYLNESYFNLTFNSSKYEGWAVMNDSDESIAFLVVYLSSNKEVIEKVNDESIKGKLDNQIVCIDTIVVHPNYRKKGIGKILLNKAIQKYNKKYAFVMCAWSQKGLISIQSLANYYNFKELKEYPDLWRFDCEEGDFNCPAKVSDKACCCSMVLYYLKQKI
jgi:GNAT superfamily N-acetyltransferase